VDGIVDPALVGRAQESLERAERELARVQKIEGERVNDVEARLGALREDYGEALLTAQAAVEGAKRDRDAADERAANAEREAMARRTAAADRAAERAATAEREAAAKREELAQREAAQREDRAAPSGGGRPLGLKIKNADGGGVLVLDVKPGALADLAQMRADDVIVGVDGEPVRDAPHLMQLAKKMWPNRRVYFEVLRGSSKRVLIAPAEGEGVAVAPALAPPAAPAREPERQTVIVQTRSLPEESAGEPSVATSRRPIRPQASDVPPNKKITAAYKETTSYTFVFKNLEEFLGWQSAHGKSAGLYNRTAFDFHDAADGARVRIAGRDQECYLFNEADAFGRFEVDGARQYYNVKCHDEGTFAF
jgi:hypothetical protein